MPYHFPILYTPAPPHAFGAVTICYSAVRGKVGAIYMSGRVKRALHAVHQAIRPGGAYHLDTYHALTPVRFQPCTVGSGRRLNLFIPNIERSRMYGGQKTAFRFFTALLDECGGDARILVEQPCDAHQLEVLREQYPDWQIVGASEQSAAARQIVILDPDTRERTQLPVRPLDYFVYTYWTGAYALAQYEAFQRETFGRATPHIHLIQDFEPGFKAWSADYLLADSIYHQPNTIAVFNSTELKDWFDRLGYGFTSSYVFSPKLDPDIAKHLHDVPADHAREKLLVFYGRPSIPRNCFPLIVNALNLLLTRHPEVSREWKILSIGSSIGKITLADGQRLQTAGKMTLDDYAALMHRASVGVSLMCSPHPSYPPLEMAAFGITTITNSFVTKDLSAIPHITSLDALSIEGLANAIWQAMQADSHADDGKPYPPNYAHYLEYTDFFDGIIDPLCREVLTDAEAARNGD